MTFPVELGNDVFLGKPFDWVKQNKVLDELRKWEREDIQNAPFILYKFYRSTSTLGEFDNKQRSIQENISEDLLLTVIAAWIQSTGRPFEINHRFQFQKMGEEWVWRDVGMLDPFLGFPNQEPPSLDGNAVTEIQRINKDIKEMEKDGALWFSIRFIPAALSVRIFELQLISTWAIIEALFGVNSSELSFRLCLAMSQFVGNSTDERKSIFSRTKAIYDLRSKILHGVPLVNVDPKKADDDLSYLTTILRSCLKKIIQDDNVRPIFASPKNRQKYIEELYFR